MSCTLATLAACFSLQGFYMEAGLERLQEHTRQQTVTHEQTTYRVLPSLPGDDPTKSRVVENGSFRFVTDERTRQDSDSYAAFTLGYQLDISPRWKVETAAFYRESTSDNQWSDVGASIKLRWQPFGRRD